MITGLCKICLNLRSSCEILACDAFPDGIPIHILRGDQDHRYPINGDSGHVFRTISTDLYQRFTKIAPILRVLNVDEDLLCKLRFVCTINPEFVDLHESDRRVIMACERIAEKLASGEVNLQDLISQTETTSA